MPNYYEDATNDYMFATEQPSPCSCETGRVNKCNFDRKEKLLTIQYEFKDSKDSHNQVKFTISQFNNPLSETMDGFQIELLDKNSVQIAKRVTGIIISGVTEAAQFQSNTFNYVDFSNSGVYAIHQFILESSIPVQRGCNIRIVYPEDMTVDDKLVKITGGGFAQPASGKQTLQFKAFPDKNTIDLVACQKNFGLTTLGTITLTQIKNQGFRHTLEDFQVYMTQENDKSFLQVYQDVTQNFRVQASQQKAGLIQGTVVASSTLVQTTSSISFKLKISQNLDTKAFMLIYLPEALQFQSKGCTVSQSTGLTENVFCQREGRRALISRIFDQPKKEGYDISFTLEMFQMPTSVQNLGLIKLVFIDIREKLPREVDVFEDRSIQSTSGQITKVNDVSVSSDLTSLMGQTYKFSFKMQHSVPLGGFFSILLSIDEKNGVSISNSQDVQSNCNRILPDGSIIGLECITGKTEFVGQPFVNISCSRAAFGDFGTEKGQDVAFEIGGLTNPRIVDEDSKFMIQTLDQDYRYIDISPDSQNFQVTMTQLIEISAIEVRKTSGMNGVINDYTIRIIPTIKIYPSDTFLIVFPTQIKLQEELVCDIGQKDVTLLKSINCEQHLTKNGILFQVLEIDNQHKAGIALELIVKSVRNPFSTRPTDLFSQMIFSDGSGGQMAHYTQELRQKTSEISSLNSLKAGIRQTSYVPAQDSMVEISFETNNPLPQQVAIVIDAPPTLMKVYTQKQECTISIQDSQMPSFMILSNAKCSINELQIILTSLFDKNRVNDFEGNIKISFKTQNPVDSQNVELQKVSYQVSIWDSSTLQYGIDKLTNVLFPSITCAYPCQTCLASNPHHCLTCLPQQTAPQFLHTPIDVSNANQTCVDICPSKQGFTSNGSRNPKKCVKCADTCKQCAQNDQVGDINICTKCKSNFPFLWLNESTCHSLGCPDQSYQSNPNMCTTCGDSCLWCSDRLTCTKCDPKTQNAYLHYNSCIIQCPYGYTPVENVCVPCEDPCETCKFGDPKTCTSCDNTGDRQFLFGNQCLKDCPINTTMFLENRTCTGCLHGCALCDYDQISICKRCHLGLLLHENKCVESCPFEFTEAPDRSVCEPRIYQLDENFIPIPFVAGAILLTVLTLISYWCTGKQSLVSSSIIAFLGPIEMATAAYQVYYSIQDDKLFIPIIIGSAGAFTSGILVNIGFIISFNKQVKSQDKQFERWRKSKWCFSNLLLWLSCLTSMTIYRLSFSRLYSLEILDIRLNRPQVFLRSILVFTWIKFLIFNIPLICVDFYGINALTWGNQCHMTMIESLTISIITFFIMIWELLQRNSLIQSELERKIVDDDSDFNEFQGLANGKIIPGEVPSKPRSKKSRKKQVVSLNQIMFQLQNNVTKDELKEAELRPRPTPRTLQKRIRQIGGVLDHIRKFRDLSLNNSLDALLEMEIRQAKCSFRRSKSLEELKTGFSSGINDDVSELDSVYSYPAFNLDKEDKINQFNEFQEELQDIKRAENNKGNQWDDPEQMNIYASARDPPPDIEYEDQHVQTMQEKKGKRGSDSQNAERMASQRKDVIIKALIEKKQKNDEEFKKQRKKQIKRRGKRHYLMNPLESEEDIESEESDQFLKADVPLHFGKPQSDMIHSVMNVEKNQSLTLFYELQLQEGDEKVKALQQFQPNNQQSNNNPLNKPSGIELSRISGDLDFSDDDEFNMKLLENDPEAKRLHEKTKIDNIEAWLNEQANSINLRTFNENDIMGNFERDWAGKIIDEENILQELHYKDREGLPVNKKGYLINQESGDILSKYTFEVIFQNEDLVSLENSDYRYELPLPFRLERFNFNPHQCFGNFEYDDDDKPMILQDEYGHRMDRNWRPVNSSGWLIDEQGNIIDNQGHIKLIYSQLMPKGQIPTLYNYEGKQYTMQNIMGIFEKDIQTKEIILGDYDKQDQKNPKKGVQQLKIQSQDLRGRRVNSKGYLLDDLGNIIDKEENIVWRSHELLYNEPPKIFNFSEFSANWIRGLLDHKVAEGKVQQTEVDQDNRRINSLGYLVNAQGDIIERWNNQILFRKVLLEEYCGQESQIPFVFRSGQLKSPDEQIDRQLQKKMDSVQRNTTFHLRQNFFQF